MVFDSYGTFSSKSKFSYDPFWKGPLDVNRYCTNKIWLTIFVTSFIIWSIIAAYAFQNGDLGKLVSPTDSYGRKCGIDSNVENKPFLFFFDITKCADGTCDTNQICLESCPNTNFYYQYQSGSLEYVKKNIICKDYVNISLIDSWDQLEYYVAQKECSKWYIKSESLYNRCIPKAPIPIEFQSIITDQQLNNSKEIILQIVNFEKVIDNTYNVIIVEGYPILGFILASGAAAFLYIILIKWMAKPIVYTSIFIICIFLSYIIYKSSIQYFVNSNLLWLYSLIFCTILLFVVIISTIFQRQNIDLACQIFNESSKAVTYIWSSFLFAIWQLALHLFIIVIGGSVFFLLKTMRIPVYQVIVQKMVSNTCICPPQLNYNENDTCDPNLFISECKDINGNTCSSSGCYLTDSIIPEYIVIYQLISILICIWLFFFISAFGQMVLGLTFSTWYWTFIKTNVPVFIIPRSLLITIRYHIGTLAFGSLITWICDIIQLILRPINKVTEYASTMNILPMIYIKSLIHFVMDFIKYINNNAYIMCSMHGQDYCQSAKTAFNLIIRNVMQVIIMSNITDWILIIAKYFIVILTSVSAMIYYNNEELKVINYVPISVIIVAIGSYLITTLFFSVYKTAADTVFLCFLEDSECNDGTQAKPYYMSMRLKKLLQK